MVDILMAVYNGEKYLREQIDSIINQSYKSWRLFICDDCSGDSSFKIASEYAERYKGKIIALKNPAPTGSAQDNFMGMLKLAEADYIMFSDQDDVWLPDKIRLTLGKMKRLEKKGKNIPLLVHTELEPVNAELDTISESFTRFQGLDPSARSLNRLLAQNNVSGCTTMINRRLLEIVKNAKPSDMLMHDWWFALAAASFGKIGFVPEATIKYRNHGANQLGAVNNRNLKGIVRIVKERMKTKKRVSITYTQAERFYTEYKDILPAKAAAVLKIYTDIPNHCKAVRILKLLKYNFLKQNFITAAGQLIFC